MEEDILEFNFNITINMETVKRFFCWIIYTTLREDVGGKGEWTLAPDLLNLNTFLWIKTPKGRTFLRKIWDQDVARRKLVGLAALG
jgi:hypothetical protein